MKKIALTLLLIPLFSISCAKKENKNNNAPDVPKETESPLNPTTPNVTDIKNPLPIPPEPTDQIKPIEKITKLNFGDSGLISVNNETGEYEINSPINGTPEHNKEMSIGSFFDSYVPDNIYAFKSSLFPVDKFVYFQLPDKLIYDKDKTIDGSSNDGIYNAYIQFWGKIKTQKSYFACYKSVNGEYSKLDFVIDNTKYRGYCSELAPKVKSGEIKPLDIKGDDFIFLRVYGFRVLSYGECFKPETCEIFHKFNLKYYIQKN